MRANGFTLVELLAAMVAGSLLLLSLGWTVSSLARQMPVTPDTLRMQRLEKVAPLLTAWIEQAQFPDEGEAVFAPERRQLMMIVPPPQARAGAGPIKLTLSVRASSEGQALFATLEPLDQSEQLPARNNILADGYRDIYFEYQPGDQGRLPKLVTINFVDGNNKSLPVSASPKINGSGNCRFDPISLTCR